MTAVGRDRTLGPPGPPGPPGSLLRLYRRATRQGGSSTRFRTTGASDNRSSVILRRTGGDVTHEPDCRRRSRIWRQCCSVLLRGGLGKLVGDHPCALERRCLPLTCETIRRIDITQRGAKCACLSQHI
jgi:hypothetical protein